MTRLLTTSFFAAFGLGVVPAGAVELTSDDDAIAFCALSEPAALAPRVEGSGDNALCSFDGSTDGARIEAGDYYGDDILEDRLRARDYGLERGHLLLETHEALIDGHEFAFLPYDADLGVLPLSTVGAFPFSGGNYVIAIEADDTVAFAIDAERAAELETMREMNGVALRLVFNVASIDDPDRAYCAVDPSGIVRIDAHLLAAELVAPDGGAVVYRAESKRLQEGCVRHGESGDTWRAPRPEAMVTSLHAESGGDELSDEVEFLRASLETELTGCYVEGLRHNGRLQGAITLGINVGVDGIIGDVEVLVDAVGSSDLTACSLRALDGLVVPRPSASAAADVRATIVFRTAEP